mgnify:FL=1
MFLICAIFLEVIGAMLGAQIFKIAKHNKTQESKKARKLDLSRLEGTKRY